LITAASFILIRAQIHTTHPGWSDGLDGQIEASYRNSKTLEFNHPQSWRMTIFKNASNSERAWQRDAKIEKPLNCDIIYVSF